LTPAADSRKGDGVREAVPDPRAGCAVPILQREPYADLGEACRMFAEPDLPGLKTRGRHRMANAYGAEEL